MEWPKIIFQLDSKKDAAIAWRFFLNRNHGGVDFWRDRAEAFHEQLVLLEQRKEPKKNLERYVENLYQKHEGDFQKRREEIEALVATRREQFFEQTEKLFPGHPWPRKKIIAVLSVFDFCPRFLETGEFQIFLAGSDEMILFTVFHEMLHVLFYDYAQKTFPERFAGRSTEEGSFWILAELFNVVVQRTPGFIELHGDQGETVYPQLKPYQKKAEALWKGKVDDWMIAMDEILFRNDRHWHLGRE